jgi:hypothetical protein
MIEDDLLVVLGLLGDEVPVYAIARELEVLRQEISRGLLRGDRHRDLGFYLIVPTGFEPVAPP